MKKILSVLLAVSLVFCLSVSALAAANDTTLHYELAANGSNEITVKTGDVITVQYLVTADTKDDWVGVSTAQNEILFDTSFFELVPGSNSVSKTGVTTSTPVDGSKQYVYFNWTSDLYFDKDTPVAVASFQLKVIATSGSGMVTNSNYKAQDSSSALFGAEATDLKVTIEGSTEISVSSVTLNKTSAELKVGDTVALSETVSPSNAANKSVNWTSSNSSVAVVDGNGTVTAKGVGTATITVATVDGNKTASCTVTVSEAKVAVTGVSLNKTSTTMKIGGTETLTATVEPSNATNRNVTWSSSDNSIAAVDGDGKITAKAVGTATITATTADGGKTVSCTVTVSKDTVAVTGVKLDASAATLKIGESKTLTATVEPSNATNQNVTWSSSNNSVAAVDETGKITAKAAGKATITVKTVDGEKTASCEVTVQKPIANITVSKTENGGVSVENSEVSVGDTVIVKVEPNSGYEYKALSVTDEKGGSIVLNNLGNGRFSFKMPSGTVAISAEFTKKPAEDKPCSQDGSCPAAKFTDLDLNAWYHDGVHYCVENSLMQGVAADKFNPTGTTSRAMIVTILWRMEGCPVVNSAMSFKDVPAGQWYTEAIRWAQSTGVVDGYSPEAFGPDDPITREQMALILCRFAKNHGIDVTNANTLTGYTDVDKVSSWALDAMKWANAVGLVQGRSATTLVPGASITRVEAATMIQRYCENVK